MSKFVLYPTLNDKIIKNASFNKDQTMDFYFFDKTIKSRRKIRISETIESDIYMKDEDNRWDSQAHNLIICKKINLKPKMLFGPNGVAPRDAKIGLAIKWESTKTWTRGVSNHLTLSFDQEEVNETIELEFGCGEIKEYLDIQLLLFLEEPGQLREDEEHLANIAGSILGVFESKKLILTGSGSFFPTHEYADNDKPLWWVTGNFDLDERVDEDNICLCINPKHKDYKLLNPDNDNYNKELIEEIMISVVVIILTRVGSSWGENDFVEGTLGSLVKYYLELFNVSESDSIEHVFCSVNKELRK